MLPAIVATPVFELVYENAPVEFVEGGVITNVPPGEYVLLLIVNVPIVVVAGVTVNTVVVELAK